ncbi:hypothetical protein ASG89_33455 [Paenibacillus sp. Soil766]|nr:hypothetical protein ASG89_33455 [Paenibacillus sp. Soil766]
MKRIMWSLFVLMVVCYMGILILQREAKQKVYSHLGAGKYEIKSARLVFTEHGLNWRVTVSETRVNKQLEFTEDVTFFASDYIGYSK